MIKVGKSQDELWYIDQGLLEEASLMFLWYKEMMFI